MKSIVKFSVCLFAFVICLNFSSFNVYASDQEAESKDRNITWYNYEDGMALGKKQSKKVLINFYADWCRYCKQMDRQTFKDDSVISYLNENFVSIKVNSDKNRKIALDYKVRGLPATWFVAETGENIGNRPGFIPPQDMMYILKYINTDSYKKMNFTEFMKQM